MSKGNPVGPSAGMNWSVFPILGCFAVVAAVLKVQLTLTEVLTPPITVVARPVVLGSQFPVEPSRLSTKNGQTETLSKDDEPAVLKNVRNRGAPRNNDATLVS